MAKVACVAGDTATAAGGTHPTGMHSCYDCCRLGDFVSEPSPFRVASSDDNLNIPLTVGYNSILFPIFKNIFQFTFYFYRRVTVLVTTSE